MPNDIDWSRFAVGADEDGEMWISHDENGCNMTEYLPESWITIAETMERIEEHLKVCPVWTGEIRA